MRRKKLENRFKILAVDDSLDTLEVIQRNLTPEGYKVFTVSSVNEAVNILETHPIDLVITDLKMPIVGGLDLKTCEGKFKRCRNNDDHRLSFH